MKRAAFASPPTSPDSGCGWAYFPDLSALSCSSPHFPHPSLFYSTLLTKERYSSSQLSLPSSLLRLALRSSGPSGQPSFRESGVSLTGSHRSEEQMNRRQIVFCRGRRSLWKEPCGETVPSLQGFGGRPQSCARVHVFSCRCFCAAPFLGIPSARLEQGGAAFQRGWVVLCLETRNGQKAFQVERSPAPLEPAAPIEPFGLCS